MNSEAIAMLIVTAKTEQPYGKLKPQEISLLKKYASDGISNDPLQKNQLMAILSSIKDKQCWLICDCKAGNSAPRMTLVNLMGTLFLRRIPTSATHQENCPFNRQHGELDKNVNSSFTTKRSDMWGMYERINALSEGLLETDENEKGTKKNNARIPRLGRHLYTLLEKSQLNIWQLDNMMLPLPVERLVQATKSINIDADHNLEDYFFTSPHQIKVRSIQLKMDKTWDKRFKPQAFGCFAIDFYDEANIVADRQFKIPYLGRLYRSSGRITAASAPFIALASIIEVSSNWYNVADVFVLPIIDKDLLFPVESHYERMVALKCIEVIKAIKKKGIDLKLIKPLFGISVEGELCRPDFILESQHKKAIVEVMGSHEEKYIQAKTVTVPRMRQLGEYLEIDIYESEQKNNTDEALNILARGIYRTFLR